MKEKIKERLRAKFAGVNLSQKRIDEISTRLEGKITEESEIDGALDTANEYYPFADIAKEDDRVRTLEALSKKTPQDPPQKPEETEDKNTPEWAKSLVSTVTDLKAKLDVYEQKENKQTSIQKAIAKLKEKNIPDSFSKIAIKNLNANSDEEIESFVSEIESSFTEFQQSQNIEKVNGSEKPFASGKSPDTVKKDIEEWAKKKQPQPSV